MNVNVSTLKKSSHDLTIRLLRNFLQVCATDRGTLRRCTCPLHTLFASNFFSPSIRGARERIRGRHLDDQATRFGGDGLSATHYSLPSRQSIRVWYRTTVSGCTTTTTVSSDITLSREVHQAGASAQMQRGPSNSPAPASIKRRHNGRNIELPGNRWPPSRPCWVLEPGANPRLISRYGAPWMFPSLTPIYWAC